jgi:molybdopterin synthase catalytic subunit
MPVKLGADILTPLETYTCVIAMPVGILAKKGDQVDLAKLISGIKESVKGKNCGSIVTFTGIIRPRTHGGDAVDHLEYEVYEEAARRSLGDMANAISLINGVLDVALCHRYGTFFPGEEVLYVVIATERSDIAFETLRLAVTRAKHEFPIWKKEFTEKGDYWVDVD